MSLSTQEGTNTTNEDPSENVQQEVSDLHFTELSPVMNEALTVIGQHQNQSLSHFRQEETEGYHLIDILQNMFLGMPGVL